MISNSGTNWLKLRRALVISMLSVVAMCGGTASQAAPNIVLILADDLSLDAMNTLLDGGWLPNINTHLVEEGVTFDNSFVTNPVCCPSRATLLTGRYSHNHLVLANSSLNPLKGGIAWPGWFPGNGQPGHEQSTIATWLQDAGYRTGFIGKYLNGYGKEAPAGVIDARTYVPPGWDTWNGLTEPSVYRVFDYEINENGVLINYGENEADYQTDVIATRATDFTANTQAEPFFLLIAPLAPHLEVLNIQDIISGNGSGQGLSIRPAPRHAHLIDGDELNGEMPSLQMKPSFDESDISDKPSCPRPALPIEPALISDPACVGDMPQFSETGLIGLTIMYKSMLASMIAIDDLVGSVVDNLSATGKLDNTVIIFTSDNGWFYGEHRMIGKELAYEESIRVPYIIRAPGGKTGSRSTAVILNNDIAPTLADLAGVTPPYDPDGASIMPLVDVTPDSAWYDRKRFLIERWFIPSLIRFSSPTYVALRALTAGQDFVYIATRTDPTSFEEITDYELYVMSSDPHQLTSFPLAPGGFTSFMDSFLALFRNCSGEFCRLLESL